MQEGSASPVAFVSGASGYIGRRLSGTLVSKGWTVHALVRQERTAPNGTIVHRYDGTQASIDFALAAAGQVDVVFHLASLVLATHTSADVPNLVAANLLLPLQLMEAATAVGIRRLVNTGTHWQHAEGSGQYVPFSLYSATKQAAEDLARWYARERGLYVTTLKLFDVYGPQDPRKKILSFLIDAALTGKELPMSPGHQQIDLVHVDDVVSAYECAAGLPEQGRQAIDSFAVRSGHVQTLRELAAFVQELSGRHLNIDWGKLPYRPNQIMTLWPEAAALPGWKPTITQRDGVTQIIRENVGAPVDLLTVSQHQCK